MSTSEQKTPKIYSAISAITGELSTAGVAKNGVNEVDGYRFRSLDDVVNALSPLLAKHRLCILPKIVSKAVDRVTSTDFSRVIVHAQFDLVCAGDGSQHSIEALGEAIDKGDKAVPKAMSAAFKHAMIQLFCIPVTGQEDADRITHSFQSDQAAEPVQGWTQWTSDIIEMMDGCQTVEAVLRVNDTYRTQLRALSHSYPALFAQIGAASAAKRSSLMTPVSGAEEMGSVRSSEVLHAA